MPGGAGPQLRERLGNNAAEGVTDDIGRPDVQRIQQQLDVIGKVETRVTAVWLGRGPMTTQIDDDQTKPWRQQGRKGRPISSAVGVAVNQDQRRGLAGTGIYVRECLAGSQNSRCLLRIKAVQIRRGQGGLCYRVDRQ